MQRKIVSVKPKTQGNYLVAKASNHTELLVDGAALTGVRKEYRAAEQPMAITMPEGIAEISNYAFRGWKFLHRVCFYDTPYQMGAGAFAECTSLEAVTLAEGTDKIPLEAFTGCHSLKNVALPNSVRRINMDAFKNCYGLKEIAFPSSLEVIEPYAFWGCRALQEVNLPETLTELGEDAFASCTGLKQVRLPDSLRSFGFCVFMNCLSLEEIVIPSGVTELPMGVFEGCRNLKKVVLPDTLESIHPYAFYRCDKLEQVEHPEVERFAWGLEHTPFWRNHFPDAPVKPQLPMELLNKVSGAVSGAMLSAMGYHWFEVEREYRIFLTREPGVIEVKCRYDNGGEFLNDCWLMNEQLEPLPGIHPLIAHTDTELRISQDFWQVQLEMAAAAIRHRGGNEI